MSRALLPGLPVFPTLPLLLFLLLAGPWQGWAQTPGPTPSPSVPAEVLLQEIRSAVEQVYHNPNELEEPRWERFWSQLEDGFTSAEDHAELRAAFRSAVRGLGISHFSLQRQAPTPDGGSGREPVRLSYPDPEVALLEVDLFTLEASAEPLVRALIEISRREVPSLVVDLAPFQDALSSVGALVGVVPPMPPTYQGQVYILTGPNTGSAAEPVVHFLREAGLATVVGERTAGAMLSSETLTLSDGWHLVVPAADYITADGVRLEGRGVRPHVEVPADQALEETLRLLRGEGRLGG